MVERLCASYGDLLIAGDHGEEDLTVPQNKKRKAVALKTGRSASTVDESAFYAFPTLEQLSKATEKDLLGLGFGYRAKYITGAGAVLGFS